MTDGEIERIRKLYEGDNVTVATIATVMRCSQATITNLAKNRGWRRRSKSHKRQERAAQFASDASRIAYVRAAYESGHQSIEQIAFDAGMKPRRVRDLAAEHGWSRSPHARTGWKRMFARPNNKHHFNGHHGSSAVANDARAGVYPPELLAAIKTLQKADFIVYRTKGDEFMVGTRRMDAAGLMEKAGRYERRAA